MKKISFNGKKYLVFAVSVIILIAIAVFIICNINNSSDNKTSKKKNKKWSGETISIYKCDDAIFYTDSGDLIKLYYSLKQTDACNEVYKKIKVYNSNAKGYDLKNEFLLYEDGDIYVYNVETDVATKLNIGRYEKYKFIYGSEGNEINEIVGIMAGNLNGSSYDSSSTVFYNIKTKKEMYKGKYYNFRYIDDMYIEGQLFNSENDLLEINKEKVFTINNIEKITDEKIKNIDGKIDDDTTTTSDISRKVSLILSNGNKSTERISYSIYHMSYTIKDGNINFNGKQKILLALNSLRSEFDSVTEKEAANIDAEARKKICGDSCNFENGYLVSSAGQTGEIKSISGKVVEKKTKELFGTAIENFYFNEDDKSYSNRYYVYDSTNDKYYLNGGSGGVCGPVYLIHKDKYVKDNDKIYAYISVAHYLDCGGHDDENKIYGQNGEYLYTKDFHGNEILEVFEIQENYEKYEHYRMVFQKDSNNYYYSSIEKVN